MNKTILLIDDDVDIIEINRAILTQAGYQVKAAYNGDEGLEMVKTLRPDLIVLDVMMTTPGEGFEVAQRIRADEATRRIPILMVTNVNKETGFNLQVGPDENWNPVDDFIDKPIGKEVLLQKVTAMLSLYDPNLPSESTRG